MNGMHANYLEHLRLRQDAPRLRRAFRDLAASNRQRAVHELNDDALRFPTLFLLMPEIEALDLYEALTPRNNIALQICAKKTNHSELSARLYRMLPKDGHITRGALHWMLDTGQNWDGPDKLYDSFDAAMDAAAALLIRTYGDTAVLPAVSELIFRRNRKGLFIHDLVWSFFQSSDPDALKLIAKHLLSDNRKDVALACKLLHLTMPEETGGAAARQKLYRQYLSWLSENHPYLRFSGEHFQQTSEPSPLYVDSEARYLCKRISPKDGKPLEPLTQDETGCLLRFRSAAAKDREILSSYSARIHDRDINAWKQWMRKTVPEQVSTAKSDAQVV